MGWDGDFYSVEDAVRGAIEAIGIHQDPSSVPTYSCSDGETAFWGTFDVAADGAPALVQIRVRPYDDECYMYRADTIDVGPNLPAGLPLPSQRMIDSVPVRDTGRGHEMWWRREHNVWPSGYQGSRQVEGQD